tara:strand:+ start:848 stop:1513 length:666 start_codon:yes stop_codon:yes gene_type:complete
MNYKLIQNNILKKNQNMVVFSSTGVAGLSIMIYHGILNTALLFFGLILPLYQIINIVGSILPIKDKSMKKDQVLNLTKWNLILANHIILNFLVNLFIFINSFYIKIGQLVILYLMYKFADSVNTSFDNSEQSSESSETINNNIVLTDVLLLVNKNRVSKFNNILNNYFDSFKNLDINFNGNFVETVSNVMGTTKKETQVISDPEEKENILNHDEEETEADE